METWIVEVVVIAGVMFMTMVSNVLRSNETMNNSNIEHFNTFKYNVFAPMGRFQLKLILIENFSFFYFGNLF